MAFLRDVGSAIGGFAVDRATEFAGGMVEAVAGPVRLLSKGASKVAEVAGDALDNLRGSDEVQAPPPAQRSAQERNMALEMQTNPFLSCGKLYPNTPKKEDLLNLINILSKNITTNKYYLFEGTFRLSMSQDMKQELLPKIYEQNSSDYVNYISILHNLLSGNKNLTIVCLLKEMVRNFYAQQGPDLNNLSAIYEASPKLISATHQALREGAPCFFDLLEVVKCPQTLMTEQSLKTSLQCVYAGAGNKPTDASATSPASAAAANS